MKTASWKFMAPVLLLMAAGAVASGRDEAAGPASLEGNVTAPGQVCLQGVSITVDSTARALHFETKTDEHGYYKLPELPAGSYILCADAHHGGCIVIPRLVLNYGEHARHDFHFSKMPRKGACDPLQPALPAPPK